MSALFFTDIDGTLTDHDNYSYKESLPGVDILKERSIPLIPVSSKTFEEMRRLVEILGLDCPFAFENGSGIAYPSAGVKGFDLELKGPGIQKLMAFVPSLEDLTGKKINPIISFSDSELSRITGLDPGSANLAKKRITTLPFIADGDTPLDDNEITMLNNNLRQHRVHVTRGGRFNHLIPSGYGKDYAVKKIIEFYRDKYNSEIVTAAAGDSLNDIPMLESVDYPFVVRKKNGSFISFKPGKIMKGSGPAGFSEAVDNFITIIAG